MNVEEINVVTLAYLGDAIYEVYIRKYLLSLGIAKVKDLQRESIKFVSAKSQSNILNYLIMKNILTKEEIDIVKRGRNYRRASHPRNTDIITYKMATGFEALIGYLYMTDNVKRLDEIINIILGGYNEKNI